MSPQTLLLLLLPSLIWGQCDDQLPSGKSCGPDDFFTEAEISLGKTARYLMEAGEQQDEMADYGEKASLNSIQGWLIRTDSKLEMRTIPPLPQQYFVLLWKSLYALFIKCRIVLTYTKKLFKQIR